MEKSKVSVIVTTKNEESDIEFLLKSIKAQSYKNIEIILVDNNSTDKTISISRKFTTKVFNKGPERSAQRNYGAGKSIGAYLLFLDADMILAKHVVGSCVKEINKSKAGGIIIPEESFGEGFWTRVKAFERSFYIGDDSIEAARFYPKQVFNLVKGFDETINGPEDWDLSDRVRSKYGHSRITDIIKHNEGCLTLWGLMKKKYYYGLRAHRYVTKNKLSLGSQKTFFFLRSCFYKNPRKLIAHPLLTLSLIGMLSCELLAGGVGYVVGSQRS